MDLAENTLRYWTLSRAWNGHPMKGRKLTVGGCITACNKILNKTDPKRPLSKQVNNLLNEVVYQEAPTIAATN
jgi:hypothetical protein